LRLAAFFAVDRDEKASVHPKEFEALPLGATAPMTRSVTSNQIGGK
jgi:hypothetical protein